MLQSLEQSHSSIYFNYPIFIPILLLSYCEQVKIHNHGVTNTKQYSNKQKPRFCKDADALNTPSISPEVRLSAVNSAWLEVWSSQGPKYFTEEMYIAELVCSKFMSQTPRQLPNYGIFSKAVKNPFLWKVPTCPLASGASGSTRPHFQAPLCKHRR